MELWIRSQDRTTLIRSYEIYISEQQDKYLIRAKRTSHILGSYKTFERALEVLDEISDILKPKFNVDVDSVKLSLPSKDDTVINASCKCDILKLDTYVYEMPEE